MGVAFSWTPKGNIRFASCRNLLALLAVMLIEIGDRGLLKKAKYF